MLANKIPFLYFESIEKIDYEYLKQIGVRGLIFDLDNTIITPDTELIPKEKIELLKNLEKSFKLVIVTNNSSNRMETANQGNFDCVPQAKKPEKTGFIKALNILNLDKRQVALIGDQLISDIKGGNKFGIKTILVNPVDSKKDGFWTKWNRFFEKQAILKFESKHVEIYNKYFKNFRKSFKNV